VALRASVGEVPLLFCLGTFDQASGYANHPSDVCVCRRNRVSSSTRSAAPAPPTMLPSLWAVTPLELIESKLAR
jgi:hypothetical protein